MESLAVMVFGIFVVGLMIEISKYVFKALFYFFQLLIVITIIVSVVSSITSYKGDVSTGIPGVCNRVDGCPLIDGVCIGCD